MDKITVKDGRGLSTEERERADLDALARWNVRMTRIRERAVRRGPAQAGGH